MKKFIVKLLLFLPVFIIVVLINLTYDPAHLFDGGKYEKELANYLLEGKNVANVTNYDVKLMQKYYVEGLESKKDLIVLGSSRSLSLKQNLFPGKSFFNNSINGASIKDYDYVYNSYLLENLPPSLVIIGLDPWILNRNKYNKKESNQNLLTKKAQAVASSMLNLPWESLSKYYQLVSPSYFQSAFPLFLKDLKGKEESEYFGIDDSSDSRIVKFADGSMNLKKSFGDDPQKVKSAALTYDPVPLFGNFDNLDLAATAAIEALVDKMQENGSEVVFYFPPYHPITYQNLILSQGYKIILKVQDYFSDLALKRGIKVYGSYNPKDYELEESDFYDGTHPKESATAKIFERVLE